VKIEVVKFEPLQDFLSVKNQVFARKGRFSADDLSRIPYEQLFLCCTGEAGSARCSREMVTHELQSRRSQFMDLETNEAEQANIFLLVNQMDEDIRFAKTFRNAPHWNDLTPVQKTWAVLNCILNHVDRPHDRINSAILLLRRCAIDASLPPEMAMRYMPRLRSLLTLYPSNLTDAGLRQKVDEMADNILELMSPEEAALAQKEQIQGYMCTSDCYRVLV
jgi:hypothetical protein